MGLERRQQGIADVGGRRELVDCNPERLVDRFRRRGMTALVEPVAFQQRAEPGADAEDLVRIEPAAGALDQPVDVDPVGDGLVRYQRHFVAGQIGNPRRIRLLRGVAFRRREEPPFEDIAEIAPEALFERRALFADQHHGIEQSPLPVAAGRLQRVGGQFLGHLLQRLGDHAGQLLQHHLAAFLEQLEATPRVDARRIRSGDGLGDRVRLLSCRGVHDAP